MKTRRLAATAYLFGVTAASQAHHSYTEFDRAAIVEIEGTLVTLAWQNPHTALAVRVRDAAGREIEWDIETGAVNGMRRRGVPIDTYRVGDPVKVAGWPSKRLANRMYATNVLVGGHELMFQTRTQRWPGFAAFSELGAPSPGPPSANGAAPTLFRVWAISPADPDTLPGFLSRAHFSLTDAAQRAIAAFDPVTQSTTSGCTPKGMPVLMGQPFPMEIVDRGDTIVLRLEEYDAVRTIYLAAAAERAPREPSPLGRSLGRFEGDVLVVETDLLDSPYFNSSGVPLSRAARTVERFTLSEDGRRLRYDLTVTDPATFNGPAQGMRAWVARDGERVLPFDCKAPRY